MVRSGTLKERVVHLGHFERSSSSSSQMSWTQPIHSLKRPPSTGCERMYSRNDPCPPLPSPGDSRRWNKSTKDLDFFLNSERRILCCGRTCKRQDRMCVRPGTSMLKPDRWPQPRALEYVCSKHTSWGARQRKRCLRTDNSCVTTCVFRVTRPKASKWTKVNKKTVCNYQNFTAEREGKGNGTPLARFKGGYIKKKKKERKKERKELQKSKNFMAKRNPTF